MTCSAKFWTTLITETGNSTIGVVQLGGDFEATPYEGSKLAEGPVHCCAIEHGGGYTLMPIKEACDNSVKIYWLPWIDKLVVSAKRSVFEDHCDYFLTAKLEGCRFVLTKELVLHIASNVSNAASGATGSPIRTVAEGKKTNFVPSRRLSVSTVHEDGDYKYGNEKGGGYAFVFGIK